jgi:hypothetical protein
MCNIKPVVDNLLIKTEWRQQMIGKNKLTLDFDETPDKTIFSFLG